MAIRALIDDLIHDVRYTARHLRKSPLFTVTATLSLALGIGVNAAVFAVIEHTLLRPLPVANPHELVYITDERILTQASPRFSYPYYAAIRENNILDGVAARVSVPLTTTVNGQAFRVNGELVSGNYFSVVGVSAQHGRLLTAGDDRIPGAHPVAVISDRFWRRALASDPLVIGGELQLNQQMFKVVGIAPKSFVGTDVGSPTELWIPMMMQRTTGRDLIADARTNWLEIIGRSSSGVQLERAAEELTKQLDRRAPELRDRTASRRVVIVSGERGISPVRAELGPALAILMTLALIALGLACVNIASLLAVRAAGRGKEVAIRLALGASRSRLVRQLFTEGLILAGLGGVAGLFIAPPAARLLVASQPRSLGIEVGLDVRVLAFALAASVLSGIMLALAPILASKKIKLTTAFESASTTLVTAGRRLNVHDCVVMLQIALALAMLISAALFVQSLRSFQSVKPGFRADNLLLASLDPAAVGYDSGRIEGFWRSTLARVSQVPGVDSASLARTVPLAPGRQRQPWVHPSSGEKLELDTNFIGPQYFRTLDIPVVTGREFDDRDGKASRPVVIVNERLARLFWPGQDPVGKGIRLPDTGKPMAEIVGVVRDVKYRDLRAETGPMVYRPLFQTHSSDSMSLHVRTSNDPNTVIGAIRGELQKLDRRVPLFQVTTLEEHLDGSFAATRQAAVLTGVFGVFALLLSGIGVYGVTALAVSRRTRDIGIRMALGARRRDIVRAVGGRGAVMVAAGLALGTVGSFAFTRFTGTLLFGVTPADAGTFIGMAAVLALVSLIAFCIPVRTATRLDALAAIRHE